MFERKGGREEEEEEGEGNPGGGSRGRSGEEIHAPTGVGWERAEGAAEDLQEEAQLCTCTRIHSSCKGRERMIPC